MDETVRYLRRACLAWALLWVVYNLAVLGKAFVYPGHIRQYVGSPTPYWYWWLVVGLAVLANALCCLGPILETYACVFLGFRLGPDRYLLFAIGLVLSTMVIP